MTSIFAFEGESGPGGTYDIFCLGFDGTKIAAGDLLNGPPLFINAFERESRPRGSGDGLKDSGNAVAGTLETASGGLGGVDCFSVATASLRDVLGARFRGYLATGAVAEVREVLELDGKLVDDPSTRAFFFGGETGGGDTAGGMRLA